MAQRVSIGRSMRASVLAVAVLAGPLAEPRAQQQVGLPAARAFTDGKAVSIGIHGRAGQRDAPTILNALYDKTQSWDGRVHTLEQQAALPITNPFEMGSERP